MTARTRGAGRGENLVRTAGPADGDAGNEEAPAHEAGEAGGGGGGVTAAELIDVTRTYPGGVTALDRATLRIGRGELVAIVGPSGSGKSTLLNLMGLLDTPTSGTVRLTGHDATALTDDQASALRARSVGFVFQHFHLAHNVSAVDNVADGLLYGGLGLRARRRSARRALERVGLGDRLEHRPHELSGGQRQRVAIARALVGEPDLLLADEPTGALDTASGAQVVALLRELNAAGTTVVVITHDTGVASPLPRRAHVRDGRITADEHDQPPPPHFRSVDRAGGDHA